MMIQFYFLKDECLKNALRHLFAAPALLTDYLKIEKKPLPIEIRILPMLTIGLLSEP